MRLEQPLVVLLFITWAHSSRLHAEELLKAFCPRAGWSECVGVKAQFTNHEGLVRKLLEDAREPHYRECCTGDAGRSEVKASEPHFTTLDASLSIVRSTDGSKPQSPSKLVSVSRGIKQLFQSATKFVRLLQR